VDRFTNLDIDVHNSSGETLESVTIEFDNRRDLLSLNSERVKIAERIPPGACHSLTFNVKAVEPGEPLRLAIEISYWMRGAEYWRFRGEIDCSAGSRHTTSGINITGDNNHYENVILDGSTDRAHVSATSRDQRVIELEFMSLLNRLDKELPRPARADDVKRAQGTDSGQAEEATATVTRKRIRGGNLVLFDTALLFVVLLLGAIVGLPRLLSVGVPRSRSCVQSVSQAYILPRADDLAETYQACDAFDNPGSRQLLAPSLLSTANGVWAASIAACDRSCPAACNNQGVMLEVGLGADVDVAAAQDAYEQACRLHSGEGCYNLARLMAIEPGDATMAATFADQACRLGSTAGCEWPSMRLR